MLIDAATFHVKPRTYKWCGVVDGCSIPAASTNHLSAISNLAHCLPRQLGLQLCAVVAGKAAFGQPAREVADE